MARQRTTPVLSVINMKGGVGKTTVSANVFHDFFQRKAKNVLLIDFDPQFNLTQAILPPEKHDEYQQSKKTVFHVLGGKNEDSLYETTQSMGDVPSVEDVTVVVREQLLENGVINRLTFLPGNFDMVKYTLVDERNILKSAGERFSIFLDHAKQSNDLICIDCNPSSSFLTKCAIKASTHILVPVRPDKYSLLGIRYLNDFIDQYCVRGKKPETIILINGESQQRDVVEELRRHSILGPQTLASTLVESTCLSADLSFTGFAVEKGRKHKKKTKESLERITTELCSLLRIQ